ncbi:hypothetical protein BD410DRAFT_744153 [Rickenella mellea]|uniref:HMG box domain-containing protein n=1 Tax=Rickenella mellea TaxID=50990 RepID=A0A4Y7QCJ1_9AGAM|nr:hypothetical protein BD410DRAFT_744153 [Rickenella mellea]
MMYTFATTMTPTAYGSPTGAIEIMPDSAFDDVTLSTPPDSPLLSPVRPSHGRRRDASYIPRPPNAFILFRSSFVKAQHIPGKIEGNHSTLSKIVGMYWKNLPPQEREVWERKALAAQAEHRRRYPDWRFRPANGIAKVKDGPVDSRRRNRGQGRGESEEELRIREKRCAKIVDLLGEGKAGPELAAAVEAYDRSREPAESEPQRRSRDPSPRPSVNHSESTMQVVKQEAEHREADMTFKVPLAAVSKRSSSAPAAPGRLPMLGLASLESTKGLLAPLDSPFTAYIRPPVKALLAPEEDVEETRGNNVQLVAAQMSDASDRLTCTDEPSVPIDHNKTPELLEDVPEITPIVDNTGFMFNTHALDDTIPAGGYTYCDPGQHFVHGPFDTPRLGVDTAIHSRKHTLFDDSLPFLSSYSSLKGWAGGASSSRSSPQSASAKLSNTNNADTSSIMEAAFEAASTFSPEDNAFETEGQSPMTPASATEEQYLHDYSRGKRLMNILDLEAADTANPNPAFTHSGHRGEIDFLEYI